MSMEDAPRKNELIEVTGVLFSYMDIFSVINDFYGRIQTDPILQAPLNPSRIGLNTSKILRTSGGSNLEDVRTCLASIIPFLNIFSQVSIAIC